MTFVLVAVGKDYNAMVDPDDLGLVLEGPKWQPDIQSHTVYASRKRSKDGVRYKEYMHRLITGARSDHVVDHQDGDGLNNTRPNLRRCTHANNIRARRGTRGTSKYRGVFWSKRANKWLAKINKDGRQFVCGQYASEEDAARAYNTKARRLFGKYAYLNAVDS
jgi:AP2 domain